MFIIMKITRSLSINPELWNQFKADCSSKGENMSDIIEKLLEIWLEDGNISQERLEERLNEGKVGIFEDPIKIIQMVNRMRPQDLQKFAFRNRMFKDIIQIQRNKIGRSTGIIPSIQTPNYQKSPEFIAMRKMGFFESRSWQRMIEIEQELEDWGSEECMTRLNEILHQEWVCDRQTLKTTCLNCKDDIPPKMVNEDPHLGHTIKLRALFYMNSGEMNSIRHRY